MKNGKRCTAIILSAGSGSRMKSDVAKQYMALAGKPVIWYSLQAVERSAVIDDCILTVGGGDLDYVRAGIVQKYGFSKVDAVVAGGAERYLSVMQALRVIADDKLSTPNRDGYVFIHDGARPFLTEDMLIRLSDDAQRYRACAAAMPAKDTVKITDDENFAIQTPDRRSVWNVQTPQVFETRLIVEAYARLGSRLDRIREQGIAITDDAGVVELFTECRVKLTEGSWQNIKITTPEDLLVAETFLRAGQTDVNGCVNEYSETK